MDEAVIVRDGELQRWHSSLAPIEVLLAALCVGHQQLMPELPPCPFVSGGLPALRADELGAGWFANLAMLSNAKRGNFLDKSPDIRW